METATEALIKFMKLVLTENGGDDFRDFPDLMYLTRKKLGLKDHFHSFVS
ncbi:15799_t:CDS:1, partial [Funneliformis geosporum]